MFASRIFTSLQSSGRNTLDLPVAGLAGLAVAFIAFVMPANLLAQLVSAIGLPSILPAAEPPLGMKARLAIGGGGAILVFAAAFLLLRWLDRFGSRRAEESEEPATPEPPRLRRRDIHPDAPARPPLLAVHELGEPVLELDIPQSDAPEPWLEEASPLARKRVPEFKPEPEPQPEPEAQSCAADRSPPAPAQPEPASSQADAYALSQRSWSEPAFAEPEPDDEPSWDAAEPEAPAPADDDFERPAAAAPAFANEPEWIDDYVPPAPADPEPGPEAESEQPEPVEAAQPWPVATDAPQRQDEPLPAEAAPLHLSGSIPDLMERLEQGLARLRTAPPRQPPAAAARSAMAERAPQAPVDDRLQSAIDSLQRFASRQD